MSDMIQVQVKQVLLSSQGFVVLLKAPDEERSLPIFIGAPEATAINIELSAMKMPRPLTHDLLKRLLDFLECRLMRVEVCDLKDGTFFARLVLEKDSRHHAVDCRPSDAIALALRCKSPVYVSRAIMDEAARVIEVSEQEATEAPPAKAVPRAERKLTPLEELNRKMERAVREERYEEAARLRDEIKRLTEQHKGN
jgi:hypothetical protein